MMIKFNDLKSKMTEMTGLLFTHPGIEKDGATELWMKFRRDGVYICINFEQPLPSQIKLEKLVGSGDALNCSDHKKDNELIQYIERKDVLEILEKSRNYKGNLQETVQQVSELFKSFSSAYLY